MTEDVLPRIRETGRYENRPMTVAENLAPVRNLDSTVIRPLENPYSQSGGIAVLKGNLAADGCVVKQSAVVRASLPVP